MVKFINTRIVIKKVDLKIYYNIKFVYEIVYLITFLNYNSSDFTFCFLEKHSLKDFKIFDGKILLLKFTIIEYK